MKSFVLGSIMQGPRSGELLYTAGSSDINAHEYGVLFLTTESSNPCFIDLSHEARSTLKHLGRIVLQIKDIVRVDEGCRYAVMQHVRGWAVPDLISHIDPHNNYGGLEANYGMTLTDQHVLRIGDTIGVSYLSVFEMLGEGKYRLLHDYPLELQQGPRYEWGWDDRSV